MNDKSKHGRPSREALRDWHQPLRVDGPTAPDRPQCHLVVGFDQHPASHEALRYAMDLAGRLHAFLHVAHVLDVDDLPIDPDSDDWEVLTADAVEHERTQAYSQLTTLAGNWAYYSRAGDPAQLLSAVADANDALIIIIGTSRGGVMSLMERFLGESVSSKLVHHTHRPVLRVPASREHPE